ncbi:MAG TPA: hypothetical protein VFS11_10255 [Gemmatimonadales bacterium]|nr:hypothetical protein [Gemmatimonadales bacterium]
MRLACPCGTAREAELWATVHRLDAALAMAERTAKRCAAAALALLLLVVGLLWCLTQRSG